MSSCPRSGLVFVGNLEEAVRSALRRLLRERRVRSLLGWAESFSLWPVHLTTSCCGSEFAAVYSPKYDGERLGSLPFTHPRNTNLLLVEGTLTRKMARVARLIWEQMPWPKFVLAMGSCAITGGVFYNSYNIVLPQDILPVDYYIPGCPPRPEAVLNALLKLQEKLRRGEWRPRDVENKAFVEELMKPLREETRRYYGEEPWSNP